MGQAWRRKEGRTQDHYYWAPSETALYMLYAYSKDDQGDLAPAQERKLSELVREEFK